MVEFQIKLLVQVQVKVYVKVFNWQSLSVVLVKVESTFTVLSCFWMR